MKKFSTKSIENLLKEMTPIDAYQHLVAMKQEYGEALDKLLVKYLKRKEAYEKELNRFNAMCFFEREAYSRGMYMVAGIDEAGRGPLAGPVVAAAVILPKDVPIYNLNDSKQLTPKQRDMLFEEIKSKAVSYGIGIVDEKCIDEINILNATKKAMAEAVASLAVKPEILLIDAVKLDDINIEQHSITKGDCKSVSIAAASILAKVTRDRIIEKMDEIYPQYGFSRHKGYGTREHIEAIKKYGLCPIHRVSFTRKFTS